MFASLPKIAFFNTALLLAGPAALASTPAALPTFNVASFGASATSASGTCSGAAGSATLTGCVLPSSGAFKVGQGVHIVGAGGPVLAYPFSTQPQVLKQGNGTGNHTYCYVVSAVDPFGGISTPSPQACIGNEPALTAGGVFNWVGTQSFIPGYSVSYLWYVSQDNGPFQLMEVEPFYSVAQDAGERPTSRNGWPTTLPAGNATMTKNEDFFATVVKVSANSVTLSSALPSAVSNAVVMHDDTQAIQAAINAAVAAGGGTVQIGAGSYNVQQPQFIADGSSQYPTFSTSIYGEPITSPYRYLYIPNGSPGNITLQGAGNSTVLITPPDRGSAAHLLGLGEFARPTTTANVMKMAPVAKGATQIVLNSASAAASLHAGQDIYLYSGSYSTTGVACVDLNGTAGGDCHFSELNTIAAVNGTTVTLVYPTSKKFYNDGTSSFGMTTLPVTPHHVSLTNMQINTNDPIFNTGMAYDTLVDSVTVNGMVNHGAFGGGFKRGLVVQNSSWGIGSGDATYSETEEYDQFTDVTLANNTITGYASAGGESTMMSARIYATEGSSQFKLTGNTLNNVSFVSDQTTDDVLSNNQFNDGMAEVGIAYGMAGLNSGANRDASFDSFASQSNATITSNLFLEDASFAPPSALRIGNYTTATISGNGIYYGGSGSIPVISATSGNVLNNTIYIVNAPGAWGLAVIPDESPNSAPAPVMIQGNAILGNQVAGGLVIPNPGFNDPASITVKGNGYFATSGTPISIAAPNSLNLNLSN
ncbi:hypothetical protein [Acidipila sp. EB88]|uniref:hypothetical protein n=1 Tax=Acidipila sp. EB88 TaxID=2305226 RepID=UPI000F5EDC94|nr:hypothetical protein [Acidipila sp. EB88]